MDEDKIKQYAALLAQVGGNIQKGDTVVIDSDTRDAYFARQVAEHAYALGAREVFHRWEDEQCRRQKYLRAAEDVFDAFPDWLTQSYAYFDAKKAVLLKIISEDPDLLVGVSPDRVKRFQLARSAALKKHQSIVMSNVVRWSIAAIPSHAWAAKVFPALGQTQAVEKLWQAILAASRVNTPDPVEAWRIHNQNFANRLAYMNAKQFKSLRYRNALGTDVTVELPKGHIWLGGAEHDKEGVAFNPNIPTEEIFSAPKRDGVNGRMVSSMPLAYNGNLIEEFELTFEKGRAVSCKAEKNQKILQDILDNDPGSCYLGEIALVPFDSPITQMNLLFNETLYDENASCHFALGKAYPVCLTGSEQMSEAEIAKAGINDSLLHVDFMVGSADLSIIGLDKDGKESAIFQNGLFTLDKI
jgi:aminopeptidase